MASKVALICDPTLSYQREYLFKKLNPIYQAVEKLFWSLGLDQKNAYQKNWNPLGVLIKPGDKVVIKPNLVASRDREKKLKGEDLQASSTNPSVIRPLIDYTWRALNKKGEILIIDTPLEGSDFEQTVRDLGFSEMISFLQKKEKINVKLLDLRHFKMVPYMLLDNFILGNHSLNIGVLIKKRLPGDPHGYSLVDLKEESFLSQKGWDYDCLRFHRANPLVPIAHHNLRKNEYSIANTVLRANVFINVPKMKTHKKAGVTLSLKNIIGIVNEKYWLPHYRSGTPPLGDEYPAKPNKKESFFNKISRYPLLAGHSVMVNIVKINKRNPFISEGSWEGNDTLWRVILDLNKILFFADSKGKLQRKTQRKYFTLIDGIIAGEGDGPINPTPKKCGVLLAGFNPALVDLAAATIMGFDYRKLKQISEDLKMFGASENQIKKTLNFYHLNLNFIPPLGWKNLKINPSHNS